MRKRFKETLHCTSRRVRIHKPHHPMSQSPSHHPWAPHKAPQDSAAAMPALPKKAPSSSGQANFGKRSNLVEDDNAWRLWGMFAAAVLCAGSGRVKLLVLCLLGPAVTSTVLQASGSLAFVGRGLQIWSCLIFGNLGFATCWVMWNSTVTYSPNTADYEMHSISTIFDQKSLEMNIPKKCEQPTRQDRMRRLQGKHVATTCPTNKSTFL